ncbi:hypothetical protein FOA43_003517 [Brettanomyces nanus]|uniref:Uncharacterized protein n=1 Tax=Eeniella nana TaxID=13502 RepID=A0A875S355_EENNA|nr:uncharacterized protein FOA43_003517 [Brettanomyces nanus]QPG76131.1 hypothetical protein FOA43_003517 [Brettanomyces nanus]
MSSKFETVPFKKLSKYDSSKNWIHLPYRSNLSITFNMPIANDCNPGCLLIKITWKAEDLERLTFEHNEACKVYKKYPLIAIKYTPISGIRKKFQMGFSSRKDFERSLQCFNSWGIIVKDLENRDINLLEMSQFSTDPDLGFSQQFDMSFLQEVSGSQQIMDTSNSFCDDNTQRTSNFHENINLTPSTLFLDYEAQRNSSGEVADSVIKQINIRLEDSNFIKMVRNAAERIKKKLEKKY